MEFVLFYIPSDRTGERDLRGFESMEQAWQYLIDNQLCNACAKALAAGGEEYVDDDGNRQWYEITSVHQLGCGAEWEAGTWEQWLASGGDPDIERFDAKEQE